MIKKRKGKYLFLPILLLVEMITTYGLVIHHQEDVSIHYEIPKEEIEKDILAIEVPMIELKSLTIVEGEMYQPADFIETLDSSVEMEYFYQDEKMGTYQTPGEYTIVLLFPSQIGTISKKTTLVIEKKKETKPVKKIVSSSPAKTSVPKKTITQKILSHQGKMGTAGRLYFSNLSSVALYEADFYVDDLQKIVDEKDSAAYFLYYGETPTIADHSIQGFDIIKKQKVGSIAYRKVKNTEGEILLEKYQVINKIQGVNTGTELLTEDGKKINQIDASLIMYTCNSANPKSVTIVLWKKI